MKNLKRVMLAMFLALFLTGLFAWAQDDEPAQDQQATIDEQQPPQEQQAAPPDSQQNQQNVPGRAARLQYMSGSVHSRDTGKHLASTRISDHMLHVGVWVVDPAKVDAFYKDVLGFRLQWKGGRNDDRFEWISMMVPDGYDWIEYMVSPTRPSPKQLGVLHHYALESMDLQPVYKTVVERGYKPPQEPNIARDGRWLLQLYDKNFTRTEMMVRKPVQTPCCSPNLDDYKK